MLQVNRYATYYVARNILFYINHVANTPIGTTLSIQMFFIAAKNATHCVAFTDDFAII